MNARIEIHLDSPVPPFEQVRSQLEAMIRNGVLADGARLPTVRALAGDLGLAAGTVARAYRELEAAGLIRTARRSGSTVVAPPHEPGALRQGDEAHGLPAPVAAALEELLAVARHHGVGPEALSRAIHRRGHDPRPSAPGPLD
ncbi:GntR family transcriptional regulator [Arthrobacter woluwensis]|uniref:GntR family transcriptional regulator n=1 Tax=Arthrobacter woluwensis TaxID=156980 RepID=UPI000D126041|nr:GntR family transcriptional regulator [Arthrobacter woluwensis]PSS43480.1 GntR family transcriptional regulator [Arthrobacter woluwensis]